MLSNTIFKIIVFFTPVNIDWATTDFIRDTVNEENYDNTLACQLKTLKRLPLYLQVYLSYIILYFRVGYIITIYTLYVCQDRYSRI